MFKYKPKNVYHSRLGYKLLVPLLAFTMFCAGNRIKYDVNPPQNRSPFSQNEEAPPKKKIGKYTEKERNFLKTNKRSRFIDFLYVLPRDLDPDFWPLDNDFERNYVASPRIADILSGIFKQKTEGVTDINEKIVIAEEFMSSVDSDSSSFVSASEAVEAYLESK